MAERVDALEAKQLIADGITVLDALPEQTWRQERLPGARSMPLATFDPSKVEDVKRDEPLLVYCFDQHCDLSARLCRRLDELGFERVHDLIGGRAAWTAQGFPTEGSVGDRRRIWHYVQQVPTVGLEATVADLVASGRQPFPTPVVTADGVLMGSVQPEAADLPGGTKIADIMNPAPGTVRPEKRVEEVIEQLRRDGLAYTFVTAVNGALLGLVVTAELHV
jgi:rhodanese-related sulfurtransferase